MIAKILSGNKTHFLSIDLSLKVVLDSIFDQLAGTLPYCTVNSFYKYEQKKAI